MHARQLLIRLPRDARGIVYSFLDVPALLALAVVCKGLWDDDCRRRLAEAADEARTAARAVAEKMCRGAPRAGLVGCTVRLPHGREVWKRTAGTQRRVKLIEWHSEAWTVIEYDMAQDEVLLKSPFPGDPLWRICLHGAVWKEVCICNVQEMPAEMPLCGYCSRGVRNTPTYTFSGTWAVPAIRLEGPGLFVAMLPSRLLLHGYVCRQRNARYSLRGKSHRPQLHWAMRPSLLS